MAKKCKKMKRKIYINENQLSLIKESVEKEEMTFYEFFTRTKAFLKDLLTKPSEAEIDSSLLKQGITKDGLINAMKDIGMLKSKESIDEVPIEEAKHPFGKKMIAKHYIKYMVPRSNFFEKMKVLYKDLIKEHFKQVFKDENTMVDDIISNSNEEYHMRGGCKKMLDEEGEGGGATSCGGVMQDGGSNPSAGQYDVPFGQVQRRKFYGDSLKRNKDEKNGSITMNRLK